jgi:hypothetical protein
MDPEDQHPDSLVHPNEAGPGSDDIEPDAKRRKLRKGTRSCWECKRRKVRCCFDAPSDEICVACRRRGTHCVSQEFPEEVSQTEDNRSQVRDRIVRVEALLSQLVKKVGHETESGGMSTSDRAGRTEPSLSTPISDADPATLVALSGTVAVSITLVFELISVDVW